MIFNSSGTTFSKSGFNLSLTELDEPMKVRLSESESDSMLICFLDMDEEGFGYY